jgi:hypothetical protein
MNWSAIGTGIAAGTLVLLVERCRDCRFCDSGFPEEVLCGGEWLYELVAVDRTARRCGALSPAGFASNMTSPTVSADKAAIQL